MFSPAQVQEWNRLVLTDPTLNQKYCAQFLAAVELSFAIHPQVSPAPTITLGALQAPRNIFGVPFDRSCLDGIGTWPIHAADTQFHTLKNARIVGHSAVLTQDGTLYSPHDSSMNTRQQFVEDNLYGHQGFLVDDTGSKLTIRFAQRETPQHHSMVAIFVHNIEPDNYGSFLFRQLPQLMALRDSSETFDCYISSARTNFLAEAIELLKLPRKPIFTTDEVAGDRFASVNFFQIDDAEGFLSPLFRSQLMRLVEDVIRERGSNSPKGGFYVSRSLSTRRRPWYRVMINEVQVEHMAREAGFAIVAPEVWSLAEQIRLFSHVTHVIGPSGSGMFNVMFSQDLRRVVDIETFHVTVRQHAKLYSSCEAEYSFLFSPFCSNDMQHPAHRSSECPTDKLAEALQWLSVG